MSSEKKATGVMECIEDSFTPRAKISRKAYIVLAVAMFAIVFIVWSIITYGGIVQEMFVPTPSKTFAAAVKLFTQLNYMNDIRITVIRVMVGFLIAAAIALPLGILVGTYKPFEAFIEPLTSFARYLPASAFVPLFILWIGLGEGAKIAVIIVGSLPQLLLMVAVDTHKVQYDLIEVSYTLGVSKSSVLWKVILPGSMPSIMDSLRMVLGWAWTYVVVAELLGASSGIGYMIIQAQRMLNTSDIFVGILSIGLIGLVFDFVLKWLNRVLFSWN